MEAFWSQRHCCLRTAGVQLWFRCFLWTCWSRQKGRSIHPLIIHVCSPKQDSETCKSVGPENHTMLFWLSNEYAQVSLSANTSVIMFMHMSGICCFTLACFVKFFPTQSDPNDSFKRQYLYQLDCYLWTGLLRPTRCSLRRGGMRSCFGLVSVKVSSSLYPVLCIYALWCWHMVKCDS